MLFAAFWLSRPLFNPKLASNYGHVLGWVHLREHWSMLSWNWPSRRGAAAAIGEAAGGSQGSFN